MRALWSVARGSWFPVHGPRQDGPGTPGQVLCSRMGGGVIKQRYRVTLPVTSRFI